MDLLERPLSSLLSTRIVTGDFGHVQRGGFRTSRASRAHSTAPCTSHPRIPVRV